MKQITYWIRSHGSFHTYICLFACTVACRSVYQDTFPAPLISSAARIQAFCPLIFCTLFIRTIYGVMPRRSGGNRLRFFRVLWNISNLILFSALLHYCGDMRINPIPSFLLSSSIALAICPVVTISQCWGIMFFIGLAFAVSARSSMAESAGMFNALWSFNFIQMAAVLAVVSLALMLQSKRGPRGRSNTFY